MKKEGLIIGFLLLTLLVVFRLVSHPDNLSPLWAICLFSGSYWRGSQLKFVIPVLGMLVTDLYLGMYLGAEINYLAVILSVLMAPKLMASVWSVFARGILASVIFFFVSNAGVWWAAELYPHTVSGFYDCLKMGLPFFRATLEGTLIFSCLIYGLYRFVLAPVGFEGFFKLNYGRYQR